MVVQCCPMVSVSATERCGAAGPSIGCFTPVLYGFCGRRDIWAHTGADQRYSTIGVEAVSPVVAVGAVLGVWRIRKRSNSVLVLA